MQLEKLSDQALGWLGYIATAEGPDTPQAACPKFWTWLADSAAAEQGKRRGDAAVEAAFPKLTFEELESAARSAASMYIAQRDVVAVHMQEHGRTLKPEEDKIRLEFVDLFRDLAGVLLEMGGPTH